MSYEPADDHTCHRRNDNDCPQRRGQVAKHVSDTNVFGVVDSKQHDCYRYRHRQPDDEEPTDSPRAVSIVDT